MNKVLIILLLLTSVMCAGILEDCSTSYEFGRLDFVLSSDYGTCDNDVLEVNMDWDYTDLWDDPNYNRIRYNELTKRFYFDLDENDQIDVYLYYPDYANLNSSYTAHTNTPGCSGATSLIRMETSYDSIYILYNKVIERTTTGTITYLNSTHLNLSDTQPSRDGSWDTPQTLKYNNGTHDSPYIKLEAQKGCSNMDTFDFTFNNLTFSQVNDDQYTTVDALSGSDDGKRMWQQFTIQDNAYKFIKGFSPLDRTTSALFDGLSARSAPSNFCKAYLYGTSGMIYPKITYYPEENLAFVQHRHIDGYSYSVDEKPFFVLDQNNLWWFFSAVNCTGTTGLSTDPADVHSGIFASDINDGGAVDTITYTSSIPLVPSAQTCYMNDTHYNIYTKIANMQHHYIEKVYCNDTYTNQTCNGTTSYINSDYYGATFDVGYNITEYNSTYGYLVGINYKIGSNPYCAWDSGETNLLGIQGITVDGIPDIIQSIIFVFLIAISAVTPFALFLPLIYNDVFNVITLMEMALTVVFIGTISVFARWNGAQSLKTLGFFITFAVATLIIFYTQSGLTQHASIDTFTTHLDAIELSMQSQNLVGFTVSTVNVIIGLFQFILLLPSHLMLIMAEFMGILSPALASQLGILRLPLTVGLYMFLIMKTYEVLSNRYMGV